MFVLSSSGVFKLVVIEDLEGFSKGHLINALELDTEVQKDLLYYIDVTFTLLGHITGLSIIIVTFSQF